MEPHAVAARVGRFVFTALAIAFTAVSSRTLRRIVQQNTGLGEPQALPERPRRVAEWLCRLSTFSVFLFLALFLARKPYAIGFLLLAGVLHAAAVRYLSQTAWGLPNAFRRQRSPLQEAMRRLGEVIRRGHP